MKRIVTRADINKLKKLDKPISEMTTKELQLFIRVNTDKANKTIAKISKRKKVSQAVNKEIQVLQTKGIIGKSGRAVLGFSGKNKKQLQAQARELEYFNQWKGTETKAVREAVSIKKYETFVRNNPDFAEYSYEDWRDLVSTFGNMEDLVNSFGYENFKNLHREATTEGLKVDMVTEAMKSIKELKASGQVISQENAVDILRKNLFK